MPYVNPEDKRAFERDRYAKNPDRQTAVKERRRRIARENVERVREILAESACADCGFDDPRALEFDHVAGEKVMGVMQMAKRGFSWKKILEEIEKCEVRCCNCHRIATVSRLRGVR